MITASATVTTANRISTAEVRKAHAVDLKNVSVRNLDNGMTFMRWGISGPDGMQVVEYTPNPGKGVDYNYTEQTTLWPTEYFYVDISGCTVNDSLRLYHRGDEYHI
jgi:hypothetical protein